MKEKKLILLGILLIFLAVVFAYYLISQERARHMLLQVPDSSAVDLEATDLKQQSQGDQFVDLYFYNAGKFPSDPDFLVPEKRVIYQIADRTIMAKQVLQELFRGPVQKLGSQEPAAENEPVSGQAIFPVFPAGARLRQLYILDDGTAVVDLYGDSVNGIEGVFHEVLAIQSVTRSLVSNFEEISQVRFLVEGKEQDTLAGHVSISHPFRLE